MPDDSTPAPCHEEALRRALAAHRAALAAQLDLIEQERTSGRITAVQAAEQARAARATYDRDVSLAAITAQTGWETWTGVGGVLYARRPKSSPPKVVRAPSAQALREAIDRSQG